MTNSKTFNWEIYQDLMNAMSLANQHSTLFSKSFWADDGVEVIVTVTSNDIVLSDNEESVYFEIADIANAAIVLESALNTLPQQLDMFDYDVA